MGKPLTEIERLRLTDMLRSEHDMLEERIIVIQAELVLLHYDLANTSLAEGECEEDG